MIGRCKVFAYPARQAQFEQSLKALRELFPDARESFIRKQAQSNARNVPVPKEPRIARARPIVAQLYRVPTRADRAETHRNKMLWKKQRRAGDRTGRIPRANLSRNHPDYGCTPAEHERRKTARRP